MDAISAVIQGDEQKLFARVHNELCKCGCPPKVIRLFETHKNDPLEEMIEVSCEFLSEIGYWA